MKFPSWTILAAGLLLISLITPALAVEPLTLWFPPGYKNQIDDAKNITKALSDKSGVPIRPRIAKSYPEIIEAFEQEASNLVYVGSFVQAIIRAKGLGIPLVQAVDGKEFYSGILIYPKGQNPQEILSNSPGEIAYALAATSGESCARAATKGKVGIGVANHGAAAGAVLAGKAKAAVVKNWWWEANKSNYQDVESYEIPGVSLVKNPDNVLTASNSVSAEMRKSVTDAAIASSAEFKCQKIAAFDPNNLDFSIELMKAGGIDPLKYQW